MGPSTGDGNGITDPTRTPRICSSWYRRADHRGPALAEGDVRSEIHRLQREVRKGEKVRSGAPVRGDINGVIACCRGIERRAAGSILPEIGTARNRSVQEYGIPRTNGLVRPKVNDRERSEIDSCEIAVRASVHRHKRTINAIDGCCECWSGRPILPEVCSTRRCGIQHHLVTRTNRLVGAHVDHRCRVVSDVDRVGRYTSVRTHVHRIGPRTGNVQRCVGTAILPTVGATGDGGVQGRALSTAEGEVRTKVHGGDSVVVHRDRICCRAPVGCHCYAVGPGTADLIGRTGGAILPQISTSSNASIERQVLAHAQAHVRAEIHDRERRHRYVDPIPQGDRRGDADVIQPEIVPYTPAGRELDAELSGSDTNWGRPSVVERLPLVLEGSELSVLEGPVVVYE